MLNIVTSLKTTGLRHKVFCREEKVEPVKKKLKKRPKFIHILRCDITKILQYYFSCHLK